MSPSVVLGGIRFLGCTMWTDFQLPVRGRDVGILESKARAVAAARSSMNDYALIRIREYGGLRRRARSLEPADTLAIPQAERQWLLEQLRSPFDGLTVVVTRMGPSNGSVEPKYAADWCTPALVSHLPDAFFEVPTIWVHGYTHTRFDYRRGSCRVISEPRGYEQRDGAWENPAFDGRLVVDVRHRKSDDAREIDGRIFLTSESRSLERMFDSTNRISQIFADSLVLA